MEVKLLDFQTSTVDDAFIIHMFGINEKGESFSIEIPDFKPSFYCRVPDWYTKTDKIDFLKHVQSVIGPYFADTYDRNNLSKIGTQVFRQNLSLLHFFG